MGVDDTSERGVKTFGPKSTPLAYRRRRQRYTSSREEEGEDAQMCPCGKAIERRTHIVGECEIRKEERGVLEGEMRKIDECGMEKFGTLDRSQKTIAILEDRWWPQTAKQEGHKRSEKVSM